MIYTRYIQENTIRQDVSYRGGGIEIDVSSLFGEGCKMTAYQNYLGGGMLGSIQNSYNFDTDNLSGAKAKKLEIISRELCQYLHGLTNHNDDEWESDTFEQNQSRPSSAY